MASEIILKEVTDKRGLKSFVRMADSLYSGDTNYIPPLMMERMDVLDKDKNPYFQHADVAMWIAYKNGTPVGRISAQVDQLVQKQIEEGLGHIGLFECIKDQDVADALFHTAEDWLRVRGMKRAMGPFSLSINEECGLLVDGFDTSPMIMMGHARPYYKTLFEAAGYKKEKELYAYYLYVADGLPERTGKLVNMARRNKSITTRQVNTRKLDEELALFFEIFNDAWSDNWGFTPFTDAEIAHAAKSIKPLIKKELVRIAYYNGEPAAFMVALPNINDWIADLKGKLLPFGWAKLVYRMLFTYPKRLRVPLMGVRKEFQGKPAGGLMAMLLIEEIRADACARGTEYGELSWILEDNEGMRGILDEIGAHIYKTYHILAKPL